MFVVVISVVTIILNGIGTCDVVDDLILFSIHCYTALFVCYWYGIVVTICYTTVRLTICWFGALLFDCCDLLLLLLLFIIHSVDIDYSGVQWCCCCWICIVRVVIVVVVWIPTLHSVLFIVIPHTLFDLMMGAFFIWDLPVVVTLVNCFVLVAFVVLLLFVVLGVVDFPLFDSFRTIFFYVLLLMIVRSDAWLLFPIGNLLPTVVHYCVVVDLTHCLFLLGVGLLLLLLYVTFHYLFVIDPNLLMLHLLICSFFSIVLIGVVLVERCFIGRGAIVRCSLRSGCVVPPATFITDTHLHSRWSHSVAIPTFSVVVVVPDAVQVPLLFPPPCLFQFYLHLWPWVEFVGTFVVDACYVHDLFLLLDITGACIVIIVVDDHHDDSYISCTFVDTYCCCCGLFVVVSVIRPSVSVAVCCSAALRIRLICSVLLLCVIRLIFVTYLLYVCYRSMVLLRCSHFVSRYHIRLCWCR